ncbi:hypothetical protein [Haloplanus natans]|uniref:hypothetical protein n=1 Tax=Haloplanus natans TaxID=376171 RepID=UPI000677777D|nr:hypothetical protein [Haloplanus natans]
MTSVRNVAVFGVALAIPVHLTASGAGYMDREDMLRAGLPLDAVVILLATATLTLLVRFFWPVVLQKGRPPYGFSYLRTDDPQRQSGRQLQ